MYKFTRNNQSVLRKADGAFIPMDSTNRDYQDYLVYVAGGGAVDPADGPTKAEQNAPIIAQIALEEAKQARAVREHLLGDTTALNRLKTIDDNIKLLRSKLIA